MALDYSRFTGGKSTLLCDPHFPRHMRGIFCRGSRDGAQHESLEVEPFWEGQGDRMVNGLPCAGENLEIALRVEGGLTADRVEKLR